MAATTSPAHRHRPFSRQPPARGTMLQTGVATALASEETMVLSAVYGSPFFLILSIPGLIIGIISIVDVFLHPTWAWEQSGQNRTLWIVLTIVGLFVCPLIIGLVYLIAIRPKVAAAQRGGGPAGGGGYGAGGYGTGTGAPLWRYRPIRRRPGPVRRKHRSVRCPSRPVRRGDGSVRTRPSHRPAPRPVRGRPHSAATGCRTGITPTGLVSRPRRLRPAPLLERAVLGLRARATDSSCVRSAAARTPESKHGLLAQPPRAQATFARYRCSSPLTRHSCLRARRYSGARPATL